MVTALLMLLFVAFFVGSIVVIWALMPKLSSGATADSVLDERGEVKQKHLGDAPAKGGSISGNSDGRSYKAGGRDVEGIDRDRRDLDGSDRSS